MKIFTVLGTLVEEKESKRAKYTYDEKLKKKFFLNKKNYTNMFPLLIDNFGSENVCSIYTDLAKTKQKITLANEFGENFIYDFDENYYIKNEKDYYETFKILSEVIDMADDDEVILDLTHSFRHIPILATVALISKNLQGTKNIKHIFFAKEIEQFKEYEIIDLKEYLEIANLSIILENFSQNYTIASAEGLESEDYIDLVESLGIVSNAILSNSLKSLYEKNQLQSAKINLDKILQNKIFLGYKSSLEKTIKHIDKLINLDKMKTYEKLFEMSKLMNEKGYLLNAITLLYEALGFYCIEGLKNISPKITNSFESFLKTKDKRKNYQLSNFSLNLIQNGYVINRNCLDDKILNRSHDKNISNMIKSIPNIGDFQNYIDDVRKFRNNLTHANSSDEVENPKKNFAQLQGSFSAFCIKQDILKAKNKGYTT